ncbi:hypothetical protein B0A53_04824 [Rhodotorula sp. CCFEE 5036]|nr:hypothetical protein B0A53_04824 [Rhodotorula sp. CCFEE 5036]
MPKTPSRRRPRPVDDAGRAAKRLAAIDNAFDAAAASPDMPTADEPRRRRQRAVVRDDEEEDDDEEMMEAVEIADPDAASSAHAGGGGFLPEPAEAGGFMPLDDDAATGGGFLPDPTTAPTESSGGGFLLPDPADHDGGGGGFLPEPTEGGGFFPEGDDAAGGGGGFLPVPDSMTAAEADQMQQDLDFASAGGFLPLPDVPASFNTESNDDNLLLPLPDPNAPPPPDRIALTAIPTALRSLGLHRVGLQGAELMALFEEVASDDDEAEGGKSVQRDRFREACQVLLGSDDDAEEDEDERDDYRDEPAMPVDDDDLQGAGRRRLRRGAALKVEEPTRVQPSRRATRAHPIPNEAEEGSAPPTTEEGVALEALPDDFEEDDDEDGSPFASDPDGEEEDEYDGPSSKSGQSGSKTAQKQQKKGKRGRRAIDPAQPLSPRDIAAAADTFDLFFEESPQLAFPQKERNISLLELQRACRVLKEKMTDGDLNEMLEYAARSKGSVDLDAFARILLETGL